MGEVLRFFGELLKHNSLLQGPAWFEGADAAFQILLLAVALLVMGVSLRAWKLTKAKRYLFFSAAFGFFALSFLTRFLAGVSKLLGVHTTISQAVLPTLSSPTFFHLGRLLYVFFVLLALTSIMLCSMRVYKRRLVIFFIALLFILSAATHNSVGTFYLLALLFLFFITAQYYVNFKRSRKLSAGMTFFAFLLLLTHYLLLAFIGLAPMFYVAAQVLQLVAFTIIFVILVRVLLQ